MTSKQWEMIGGGGGRGVNCLGVMGDAERHWDLEDKG
jgi:hypothetical protein